MQAFVKLNPRAMLRIPVMFLVEVGSVITTIEFAARPSVFVGLVTLWLWATVLFANFAEAVAEGRGKAQADTLRKSDSALDSYTPVGGAAAFVAILLGVISPGGEGVPRQEDPRAADEARRRVRADHTGRGAGVRLDVPGAERGHVGAAQPRDARAVGGLIYFPMLILGPIGERIVG